jgi:hypothetical protein
MHYTAQLYKKRIKIKIIISSAAPQHHPAINDGN